jgi:hypothetical protein
MDFVLYIIVGVLCFIAGRNSAPVITVKVTELNDKERREYEYQLTLNQTLLSEVQQYRALETKLRGELWENQQKLKKLQQKN